MPRTLINEDQVVDGDFVSEAEHPHSLHDATIHTDVSGTPADDQMLVWNSATQRWEFKTMLVSELLFNTEGGLIYDSSGELVLRG